MKAVVSFQYNANRNVYNLSRCNPNMFKTVIAGSENPNHIFTVKSPGQQFPAGLVMFAFMTKAKLLTPTKYTDNLGRVKSNTYIGATPLSCESQRAFSVLGHHLDKSGGAGLHVFTQEGNLVFNTARAYAESDGMSFLFFSIGSTLTAIQMVQLQL